MTLLKPDERKLADAIATVAYSNPFLPERIAAERAALGDAFVETDAVWHARAGVHAVTPNIALLTQRAATLAETVRARCVENAAAARSVSRAELEAYEDLVLFAIYHELEDRILTTIRDRFDSTEMRSARVPYFREFLARYQHFFALPNLSQSEARLPTEAEASHIFAIFFVLRRAFFQIFYHLVGSSMAMARLRASAWQSIFTHDMRRFRHALYNRMADVTTLITGPSGTGKELVARAIGLSRYVPFDAKSLEFVDDFAGSCHALNLAALSGTLIESELFGHRRGSFTGALDDHAGWFEVCGEYGSVFLDEIGELDAAIQVKLLRLLQTRSFQRIGDTTSLVFKGKLIAATNRDLAVELHNGRFRDDFYYRLCADRIVTPSLAEQLAGNPGELHDLLLFISRRVLGDESESLAAEVEEWIAKNLSDNYPWPGNFRELEQCVRNIMVRGSYTPVAAAGGGVRERLKQEFITGQHSAEEMLRRYCTLIYLACGSYEETARRLSIDRRTVKTKVDPDLLDELRGGTG
ncbi:MAG: sigma 54-interacting transcriptional regulator [Planctomycetota bacterium]